jgi:hypothetical protein
MGRRRPTRRAQLPNRRRRSSSRERERENWKEGVVEVSLIKLVEVVPILLLQPDPSLSIREVEPNTMLMLSGGNRLAGL